MHPGVNIRKVRKKKGLTLRKLGELSNVSHSFIADIESGRSYPSLQTLSALAEALRVPITDLIRETELEIPSNAYAYDPNHIIMLPVLGKIAGGEPLHVEEEKGEYMPFDTRIARINGHRPEDYFLLRVHGDSMEPRINDGDIVLVRRQPTVDNGEVAAVLCHGEEATVKRVYFQDGKILLVPENRAYPPMTLNPEDCIILGKVLTRTGKVT